MRRYEPDDLLPPYAAAYDREFAPELAGLDDGPSERDAVMAAMLKVSQAPIPELDLSGGSGETKPLGMARQAMLGATPSAATGAVRADVTPSPGDDIDAAISADRTTRLLRALEMGSKQLTGGLTHTDPVQELGVVPTNYEGQARQRAALAAQKAQAGAIDQRNFLDDQRNFLERQKMNQLSQSRYDTSLAQQKEQARLAAEKTAYGRERDVAGDKYKGEQLGIAAAHARAMEGIARAQFGQKTGETEAKLATEVSRAEIPFLGGTLKPQGSPLDNAEIAKIRGRVSAYESALGGMNRLEGGIMEYAKSPTLETKNNLASRVSQVAAALTAAAGGGVMADSEFKRAADAMGADVLTPSGAVAFVNSFMGENPEEGARLLLSKIRAAKNETHNQALEAAKSYQYNYDGPTPEAAAAPSGLNVEVRNPRTGKIYTPRDAAQLKRMIEDGGELL